MRSHFVFFSGSGSHIASSTLLTGQQAERLAEELANEVEDIVEFFSAGRQGQIVAPEVLT